MKLSGQGGPKSKQSWNDAFAEPAQAVSVKKMSEKKKSKKKDQEEEADTTEQKNEETKPDEN